MKHLIGCKFHEAYSTNTNFQSTWRFMIYTYIYIHIYALIYKCNWQWEMGSHSRLIGDFMPSFQLITFCVQPRQSRVHHVYFQSLYKHIWYLEFSKSRDMSFNCYIALIFEICGGNSTVKAAGKSRSDARFREILLLSEYKPCYVTQSHTMWQEITPFPRWTIRAWEDFPW